MNINSIDEVSRLALLFIENNPKLASMKLEGYNEALGELLKIRLKIIVSDVISNSHALQAALITAVNTGKRAFKGGVFIEMPTEIQMLLPWTKECTLNDVVLELGGQLSLNEIADFTLHIGNPAIDNNSLEIIANCWQGGVVAAGDKISLPLHPDGVLGGVFAGSFGVALGFLRVSKEKVDSTIETCGLSLWRPDLNWLSSDAEGVEIKYFPDKLWFLGLGHLGQAYVWTLSLMSFKDHEKISVVLQDTDIVTIANIDTGLLSEDDSCKSKIKKTRLCSKWLEDRGISTHICERYFDITFLPRDNEGDILICGLDNIESRKILSTSKFKNIIDCGLGGNKRNFDSITVYNLGESHLDPEEIWSEANKSTENAESQKLFSNILGCGEYDKGIGASFIGGIASTLVFSELLRCYNGGMKLSKIKFSARTLGGYLNISPLTEKYGNPMRYSKCGCVCVIKKR